MSLKLYLQCNMICQNIRIYNTFVPCAPFWWLLGLKPFICPESFLHRKHWEVKIFIWYLRIFKIFGFHHMEMLYFLRKLEWFYKTGNFLAWKFCFGTAVIFSPLLFMVCFACLKLTFSQYKNFKWISHCYKNTILFCRECLGCWILIVKSIMRQCFQ